MRRSTAKARTSAPPCPAASRTDRQAAGRRHPRRDCHLFDADGAAFERRVEAKPKLDGELRWLREKPKTREIMNAPWSVRREDTEDRSHQDFCTKRARARRPPRRASRRRRGGRPSVSNRLETTQVWFGMMRISSPISGRLALAVRQVDDAVLLGQLGDRPRPGSRRRAIVGKAEQIGGQRLRAGIDDGAVGVGRETTVARICMAQSASRAMPGAHHRAVVVDIGPGPVLGRRGHQMRFVKARRCRRC